MKSALLLSPFLAISFLVACAPKDSKIERPDPRVGTAGGLSVNSQYDSNKHLMVLLDRQVEAIQLFKAVIDADYAKEKGFVFEDLTVNKLTVKKLKLDSKKFKDGMLDQISNLSVIVEVVRNEDQSVKSVSLKEADLVEEKVIFGGNDIVLKNKRKEIMIIKAEAANTYDVTLKLVDELNSKPGKSISLNDAQFQFSLNGNEAFIISATLQHNRYGVQTGDMAMQTASSTVSVRLDGACVSVNGVMKLESLVINAKTGKPAYVRTATYNDSSVVLNAGKDTLSSAANACESRPVVDLKKLF
ncbi:MAG: hypothetical protein H7328_11205 [Bdellovibrio sp.]|nr:hypothetical protein [Bdellovibrio sp.]